MIFEKAKDFILSKLNWELSKHLNYYYTKHILDVYQTTIMYAKLKGVSPENTV